MKSSLRSQKATLIWRRVSQKNMPFLMENGK
jgi:hypothetical protein